MLGIAKPHLYRVALNARYIIPSYNVFWVCLATRSEMQGEPEHIVYMRDDENTYKAY